MHVVLGRGGGVSDELQGGAPVILGMCSLPSSLFLSFCPGSLGVCEARPDDCVSYGRKRKKRRIRRRRRRKRGGRKKGIGEG